MEIAGATTFSAECTHFMKWVYVKQTYPLVKRKIFTMKQYERMAFGEPDTLQKAMK